LELREDYEISERRACRLFVLHRSVCRYESRKSDAVEASIKLAKLNSGKYPIIAFEGSYHGMTAGALSLCSGRQFKDELLPLLPEIHFIPYAYCYRCAFGRRRGDCSLECAEYLDHVLDDPHSGIGTPAAVIIEPIQGEGGSVSPPPGFMKRVRDICTRRGVLLIADEIQAGLCRTGKMFAFEHSEIVPDIVTLSKALGGIGLPISCVAYREELDIWKPGAHIGTFRGNMVAFAAGAAALGFMKKHKLAEYASELGQVMLRGLEEVQSGSRSCVGEVRGKGMMLGVELVKDKDTMEPAPEVAKRIRQECVSRGLMIEIGGHYSNVARFLPPLVIPESLAVKGIDLFAEAVRKVEGGREV